MSKVRVNISMSADTVERLKQFAYENHTTVSQAITDWTWKAKVKNEQIRGQQSLNFEKKTGKTPRYHSVEQAVSLTRMPRKTQSL